MPPDGEDTLTFAPAIQNGINGTLLTLTSVFENDASDDLEPINVRGDEITTAYAIRSVDPIPEPSTWIILVTSLIILIGYCWSRKPEYVRPA